MINNAKAKLKDINEYINSNIKTGLEATETSIALYDLIKAKETAMELNKKDMNLLFDYFRVENKFFAKSVLTQEEFKSIVADYNDKKLIIFIKLFKIKLMITVKEFLKKIDSKLNHMTKYIQE